MQLTPATAVALGALALFLYVLVRSPGLRPALLGGLATGGLLEFGIVRFFPRHMHHGFAGDFLYAPGGIPLAAVLLWGLALAAVYRIASSSSFGPVGRACWGGLLMLSLAFLFSTGALHAGLWHWQLPEGSQLGGIAYSHFGLAVWTGALFAGLSDWFDGWLGAWTGPLLGALFTGGLTLSAFPRVFLGSESDIFAAGSLASLALIVVIFQGETAGESDISRFDPAWQTLLAAALAGLTLHLWAALTGAELIPALIAVALLGGAGLLMLWTKQNERVLFEREARYAEQPVEGEERSSRPLEEIEQEE